MALSPSAHVDSFTRDNLPPTELWPRLEFTLPELTFRGPLNAAEELIDRSVTRFGSQRPCLLTPSGNSWTYGQLLRKANQVAQVLAEDLGLLPGNRVLLRGPNTPWLVACWLGVLKAGGVVVTTVDALRPWEIRKIIDRTAPTVALADHRFLDDLLKAVGGEFSVLTFGGHDSVDLSVRCRSKSGHFRNVPTAPDDVALLAPTSGTTGSPKITMHFHRDILAIAETFARHVLDPKTSDVFTGTPPLAFTFGLGALLIFPIRFGASSLLLEKATPAELARLGAAYGATIVFTAPTAYRRILRDGLAPLLRSVRCAISSGEPLPSELWHRFHSATGLELLNALGSTEMLHIFAAGSSVPGAIGTTVPGYTVNVVTDSGCLAAPNEKGFLAVTGPTGCRYMYGDRQREAVINGWNWTGDLCHRDEEGNLWFDSRSDTMIVSSGHNISPREVEEVLSQHPNVVDVAVTGKPDPDRGKIVLAYVVLNPGDVDEVAKRQELQTFVKDRLSPYKYPRDIIFVAELPRSANGKLQYFRLASSRETRSNQ